MTEILVLIDHLEDTLTGAQQELLTLACSLGEVSVVTGTVVAGTVVTGAAAETAAKPLAVQGVQAVYTGDGEIQAPDPALVDLMETAVQETSAAVVLGSDTPDVVDALARLAVRMDAGLITSATGIDHELVVTKSVLYGAYTSTARAAEGKPLLATLRPNAVTANTVKGPEPEVTVLPVAASSAVEFLTSEPREDSGRPPLTEARTVVAAGRGVDGDLSLVEALADELGAAVGASRAATDAGWIDHSAQVGQTGVTVSPQLYVSVGISGAIQQKSGMDTADTIVAINKDEDAPVFEIADFGVVGDLNEVLPQLIDELRKRSS